MNSTKEFKAGKNEISWIGSNFKEHLYGIEFKKASAQGLETRTLPRYMNNAAILKELAPEAVELGDVLAFLKDADRERWYLFYVKDAVGILWAVSADWGGDGWDVGAFPVSDPYGWYDDGVVVSRRFSDTQNKKLSPSETQTLPSDFETRLAEVEAILKFHNLTSPTVS